MGFWPFVFGRELSEGDMMQKAETSVYDWSVYTVSYTLYANIQRVLLQVGSIWFLCTVS